MQILDITRIKELYIILIEPLEYFAYINKTKSNTV